jgi:transposase-like protein
LIVDNRTFKRLSHQIFDHGPTHADIRAFFRRFQRALEARGLSVRGVTTDGSPLYPGPIAAVFGAVPHQVCRFHTVRTQSRTEAARRRPLRLVPLSTS